ncbi:MAG: vWA domain-containing protein [Litorimonas sp.]
MKTLLSNISAKYRTDTDGSITTVFGITAPLLLLVVGVAFDTNHITNMKGQAQLMADIIGLNASIYVKNNDGPPTNSSQGHLHNTWYNANELDMSFGAGTASNNTTRFRVIYDDVTEKAIVEVESIIQPVFMSAFGRSEIEFTTLSEVKYAKKAHSNPASIFLVLDNSGSMAFDDMPQEYKGAPKPAGAKPRIDGMKTSIKSFSEQLSTVIIPDPSEPDVKFLRMGMTAYNTNIISARTVSPHWGTISSQDIDSMNADGGTVPTEALSKVQGWMNGEDTKHETMNGSDEPLKYVILMADGANSYTNTDAASLSVCTSLKNSGVEIFTIGFALEPGYFYTGVWGETYNQPNYYISPTVKDKAQAFLQDCASSDEHFILAEDADGLTSAFDKIGAVIIEDAVRIAS